MSEFLPPIVGRLLGDTRDFTAKMREASGVTTSATGEIESKAGAMRQRVGVGLTAIGGLATGTGAALEHLGHGLEVAHGGLEVAIHNAGQEMGSFRGQIDETVKRQEHFGHSATDSYTALATLTRATGDTGQSIKDMNLVTQLAAVHHSSLADAAGQVAKMHAGAFRSLKEFGINTKDAAESTKELKAAQADDTAAGAAHADAVQKLAELHERLAGKTKLTVSEQQSLRHAQENVTSTADAAAAAHDRHTAALAKNQGAMDFNKASALIMAKAHGTAEAQADTFGGKLDAVKTKLTDYASVVGAKVGPAMVTLGPVMAGVGGLMQTELLPKIGSLIAGMAGAAASALGWAASMVASAATAAAGWVADMAVMVASSVASAAAMIVPFLPLILTVGAIGLAAYELYKHWDQVWGFIKEITAAAFHFVADHINLILAVALGPLGIAIGLLKDHWDTVWGAIKSVIRGAGEVIGTVLGGVRTGFDEVVGFIEKLPGRIASVASGMWDGIKNAFKSAINWIIDHWNDLEFKIPSIDTHIPGIGKVGGFTLGTPDIPRLDVGGTVAGGGIVDVHTQERIFLPAGASVVPLPRLAGGGGATFNITFAGPVFGGDRQRVAQELVSYIRTELIRTGDRQRLGLPT